MKKIKENKFMRKEKISDKQFLLIINGPSCGGKSEVAKVILERYGGIYNGKSDVIKWLISDYNSSTHKNIVFEMTLATIRVALRRGLSALTEGALFGPERLVQLAKKASVPLFVINIEAPEDVLNARFLDRIEAKIGGARVANIDPKRFKELKSLYAETKMESPLEFDSSRQKPEEIADAVVKYLRENL